MEAWEPPSSSCLVSWAPSPTSLEFVGIMAKATAVDGTVDEHADPGYTSTPAILLILWRKIYFHPLEVANSSEKISERPK